MADPKLFDYPVQSKPSGTIAFRTLSAKFGDGYEQVGADGIHLIQRSYQITVKAGKDCGMSVNKALQAKDFLEKTFGYISFLWQPPGEPSAFRFRCPGVQFVHEGNGIYTLTATFNQANFP